jgi:hypothetical protein
MKKSRLYSCELKRYREVSPPTCSVCPRILKCRAFAQWHRTRKKEYLDFVIGICEKFPDKYIMEVSFMAEKQTFVQIVDMATGAIERITNLSEIDAMTAEEKLALSRNKNLFIVTHRLEPIVRVELKKSVINEPMRFTQQEVPVPETEVKEPQSPAPKGRPRKK